MADLISSIAEHKDLPEDDQKKAGQAVAGSMGDEHNDFVKIIARMITNKEIDAFFPETFFKKDIYDKLNEESKAKVDQATVNVADMLRHIAEFYLSKQTPDESPQLQNMIDQLWQMKERVETEHGDVYKF